MKIYTKTGDGGSTSLSSGERVSKSNLRVSAYGTVDELNSFIGYFRSQLGHQTKPSQSNLTQNKPHQNSSSHNNLSAEIDPVMFTTQNELFNLGTHLATKDTKKSQPLKLMPDYPTLLEKEIDRMSAQLAPLKNFILPGGSQLSSLAHIIRTICRRAERLVVDLHEHEPLDPQVILHLNRLSDYFFVLARYCNYKEGISETLWKP